MKIEINDLIICFDGLHPDTEKCRGLYCFEHKRPDNYVLQLDVDIHQDRAWVSLSLQKPEVCLASVNYRCCTEIRVVDSKKHLIELSCGITGNRSEIYLKQDTILVHYG